jgi:hypothetical protein
MAFNKCVSVCVWLLILSSYCAYECHSVPFTHVMYNKCTISANRTKKKFFTILFSFPRIILYWRNKRSDFLFYKICFAWEKCNNYEVEQKKNEKRRCLDLIFLGTFTHVRESPCSRTWVMEMFLFVVIKTEEKKNLHIKMKTTFSFFSSIQVSIYILTMHMKDISKTSYAIYFDVSK